MSDVCGFSRPDARLQRESPAWRNHCSQGNVGFIAIYRTSDLTIRKMSLVYTFEKNIPVIQSICVVHHVLNMPLLT